MCSPTAGAAILMGGTSLYQQVEQNKSIMANNELVAQQQKFAANNAFANYGLEAFQQMLDLNEDKLQSNMAKLQTTREATKERAKVLGKVAESGIAGNSVLALLGNIDIQESIAKGNIDTSLESSKRNYLLKKGASYQKLQSTILNSQYQQKLNTQDTISPLSVLLNTTTGALQGYSMGKSFKNTSGNRKT